MNENTTTQLENIILDVLNDWADSQINIQSASAREILAKALTEPLDTYVQQHTSRLVEDVICGE